MVLAPRRGTGRHRWSDRVIANLATRLSALVGWPDGFTSLSTRRAPFAGGTTTGSVPDQTRRPAGAMRPIVVEWKLAPSGGSSQTSAALSAARPTRELGPRADAAILTIRNRGL